MKINNVKRIVSFYQKVKTIFTKKHDMEKVKIELSKLISDERDTEIIFRWFKKSKMLKK